MMKSVILVCLSCLLLVAAQGPMNGNSRKCMCLNGYISSINWRFLIQTRPEVDIHLPSIFCLKTEIIISMGKKKQCVDPQSTVGILILKNKKRQDNRRAAITTTTSSHTHSLSSTTFHSSDSAPALSTAL